MAESPITMRPAVRAASGRLVTILLPWLALLALWYAVRASGLVSAALVPTPGEVVTRFWNLLWQGTLAVDILMSTQRVVIGVALGIALAVPVGFVLGWYRQVRSFIDP